MRRLRSAVGATIAAPAHLEPGFQAPAAPLPQLPLLAPLEPQGSPWEQDMNEEQIEVVRHEEGPLWNLAQAGSGKTRALVHRIARLVHHCGVDPRRILAVTFSRKAADEMNARLAQLGVSGVGQTWHSLAQRILREDGTQYGGWNVDEKNKHRSFVKAAIGFKHMKWIGADCSKICRFIGTCKANLFDHDSEGAKALAVKEFRGMATRALEAYAISQRLTEEACLLTFDDMLVFAYKHLLDESNRAAWAAKFDQILQDEAQDENRAQKTIGEFLARGPAGAGNYMKVGDLAQAIYSFRGSKPDYLAAFAEEWPGAKRVAMNKNYRSGRAIVAVANEIIRPAKIRLPEDMIAMRDFEGVVETVQADTLDDEGREVVTMVRTHLESGGAPTDVCVLFRLNAQSRALEEAFLQAKIPYVIIGGVNFYERKEVKDLLAYARLICERDREGDALRRCINAPFRYLGAKFVERVEQERAEDKEAGPESWVVRAANSVGVQDRQRSSAFEWVRLVEEMKKVTNGYQEERDVGVADLGSQVQMVDVPPAPAFDVLNDLVKKTGYLAWLEKEEGQESIEDSHVANVRELLRVAQQFKTLPDLVDFVDRQVAESGSNKRKRGKANAVTMMSIHRSKGLEWPIVWIVGCNDTVLPHARGDIEEERRLMYVAATRARDRLVASWVVEMATRTGLRTIARSQFLDAFPGMKEPASELVDETSSTFEAAIAFEDVPVEVPPGMAVDTFTAPVPAGGDDYAVTAPNLEHLAGWAGGECGACEKPIGECVC